MVVHCKMGGRSAKAVALLQERGFTKRAQPEGRHPAWIDRVDPCSQSTRSISIFPCGHATMIIVKFRIATSGLHTAL